MIKSNIKASYGDTRTGLKEAFIEIVITGLSLGTENAVFQIQHYIVTDENAKTLWHSNSTPIDSEKYNQLYQAVDNYVAVRSLDFSQLTPHQLEYMRLKIGLLIYVQSDLLESGNTVWELEPENWELI
ncbi:hypothetical protein [Flavobacterium panacagri]|uniref:hypothetical protein n=1 Tax=Flavobacterium panacagri TaxID=3034146 RepID=UPI0025A63356|nr:hypothetical protein [Flavobacterium panacagri]